MSDAVHFPLSEKAAAAHAGVPPLVLKDVRLKKMRAAQNSAWAYVNKRPCWSLQGLSAAVALMGGGTADVTPQPAETPSGGLPQPAEELVGTITRIFPSNPTGHIIEAWLERGESVHVRVKDKKPLRRGMKVALHVSVSWPGLYELVPRRRKGALR